MDAVTLIEPLPPDWVTVDGTTIVDAYRWLAGVREELVGGASAPELAILFEVGRETLFGAFKPPDTMPAKERRRWVWREACARVLERKKR